MTELCIVASSDMSTNIEYLWISSSEGDEYVINGRKNGITSGAMNENLVR